MNSDDRMSECGETPFLLAARGNRSVFLRVWGEELPAAAAGADPPPCATLNRVLVYDAHGSRYATLRLYSYTIKSFHRAFYSYHFFFTIYCFCLWFAINITSHGHQKSYYQVERQTVGSFQFFHIVPRAEKESLV